MEAEKCTLRVFEGYSILFSFRPVNGNTTQAQYKKDAQFSQTLLHNHTNGGNLFSQVLYYYFTVGTVCTAKEAFSFSVFEVGTSLSVSVQFSGPPISRSNHIIVLSGSKHFTISQMR